MTDSTATSETGPVVLIGMMGAGKSSVGRRLAAILGLPFVDADDEIVDAAGCSIDDIFKVYGEQAFRDVEERVIARLLDAGPAVLATGGGAFMNPRTRTLIAEKGVSVWLRAGLDVLVKRTRRRGGRPLLERGDPEVVLKELMDERYPVYSGADITIDTGEEDLESTVGRIVDSLAEHGGPAMENDANES